MRIGYYVRNYASERNIIGKIADAQYIKIYDLYEIPRYSIRIINKALGRQLYDDVDFAFRHSGRVRTRVDLIHFFNAISFGKVPWITTFETIVPRLRVSLNLDHRSSESQERVVQDGNLRAAVEAIASASCKSLIAMSQCNLHMQMEFLKRFPEQEARIRAKLHQLYPPQPLLIQSYDEKRRLPNDYLHVMFVGGAFFRKGGLEIIQAISEVRRFSQQDIRLTIISSMSLDPYATQESTEDIREAQSMIRANLDWINSYGHVPNEMVIEMMKSAHVGLLPTHADTFGYSVLEFQAAGCPVISTNVRALPEINDNTRGWVIDVPKDDLGEALYRTEAERNELSATIRRGLIETLVKILDGPGDIRVKGEKSLIYVRQNHNPETFEKRIKEIYLKAL